MKVFNGISQLDHSLNSSVVALGNFDGLHMGHQALIRRVNELAEREGLESVVYTFSPHPALVLHPERAPRALFGREDLIEQLAMLKVQNLILEPFTINFSQVSASDFLQHNLLKPLKPKYIVVGEDFAFGHQRQGTVELLRKQAPTAHFQVQVIQPVMFEGLAISSSRIRKAISDGKPELAAKLLGRPFSVRGTVVAGDGRGRTIGVPTANIRPGETLVPQVGVYQTRAIVGDHAYKAVTNVGRAPTFHPDSEPIKLETHILDQNLNLVGIPLRLEFISYLREEKRFASREELVAQIQRDITTARKRFSLNHEVDSHRA